MNRKTPQHGLSMLEFAIFAAIFGILIAAFFARLDRVQTDAERTEVDVSIRNIRVGIQLAIGEHIMRGEETRIAEVAAASPFKFVDPPPTGLRADLSNPQSAGEWTYDPVRHELAYRPRLPAAFDGKEELRWRYVQQIDSLGRTTGVGLVMVTP